MTRTMTERRDRRPFQFCGPLLKQGRSWLRALDPGGQGRIKGLRLVAAYALAALGGSIVGSHSSLDGVHLLGPPAGGFALWASVSEANSRRGEASWDLVLLVLAAALAGSAIAVVPREIMLVPGAFLVGYLRRFGWLGTGVGSQIFIGMALTFSYGLEATAIPTILIAGAIAIPSAVVPRLLWGKEDGGETFVPIPRNAGPLSTELIMGLQAALPAMLIIVITMMVILTESV